MKYFKYWHYFFVNLFGLNFIPRIVNYDGYEWFSVLTKEEDGWHLSYSRFIEKFNTEELVDIVSKCKYVVFLKVVHWLWKWRKKIDFTIDSY